MTTAKFPRTATEKIANRQLLYILFMMRTTVVIAFLPALTSADAFQDAWASAIVSFFTSALLVLVIAGLGIRFPELTAVEYAQKLIGKWPGKALGLIFIWAFLFIAATDTRIYAEALLTGFLTETPLSFIVFMMVIAGSVAAYSGIEVIARAADLLFPIFVAMIVLSLAFAVPDVIDLKRNLEPALSRGAGPVLRGSVIPTIIIAQYLCLVMIIPASNRPKKALGTALWALAGSSVVLVLVSLAVIAILGPDHGSRLVFPFFSMVRTLSISVFLERIEVFALFAWGFGIFIGVSVFMYCGSRALSQVLGLTDYRPLIAPLAVIWGTFAVHSYQDMFQLRTFFQPKIAAPYALSWIVVPMGILWAAYGILRLKGVSQMKNRLLVLIIIVAAISLTGCWNRRDPENLALVLATAFDVDEESGMHEVTVQMANPLAMGGQDAGQGGGGGEKKPFWTVSADGALAHQAMRNLTKGVSREFFWAHNRVLLFSENVAKKGIYPIMDMTARERQLRASAHVAVVKGDIKKLMVAEFPLEESGAKGLDRQIITIGYERSLFAEKTLNELYSTLSQPGIEMFIGKIEVTDSTNTNTEERETGGASGTPNISPPAIIGGGTMFKGDRMVGWANEQETLGWAYATGRVFRSVVYIKDPIDDSTPVGIDIENLQSEMKPETDSGSTRIVVEIKAKGHLHDLPVDRDLSVESGYIKSLERRSAEAIRNAVLSTIELSKELESDIIGFGNLIYRKQPKLWNGIGDKWYEVFQDMEIDVRVYMNIRRTGLLSSPMAAEKRR